MLRIWRRPRQMRKHALEDGRRNLEKAITLVDARQPRRNAGHLVGKEVFAGDNLALGQIVVSGQMAIATLAGRDRNVQPDPSHDKVPEREQERGRVGERFRLVPCPQQFDHFRHFGRCRRQLRRYRRKIGYGARPLDCLVHAIMKDRPAASAAQDLATDEVEALYACRPFVNGVEAVVTIELLDIEIALSVVRTFGTDRGLD